MIFFKYLLGVDIFVGTNGGLDRYRVFMVFDEVDSRVLVVFPPIKVNEVGIDDSTSVGSHCEVWGYWIKYKYLLSDLL